MKTNCFKFLGILLVAAFALSGCKKDSDDSSNEEYQAPSFASKYQVVEVPAKLSASDDSNAQIAASYMAMANAFSGYSAYFTVPENAVQSKTKSSGTIYTWSYDGTTVKLVYSDDETYRYWAWYINDVKFMDCKEAIGGKSGSFNIYDIERGGVAVIVYNWDQTATIAHATMKLVGEESYFFEISTSLNGESGQFDVYQGASASGSHIANVTWLSNGSGSWWLIGDGTKYSGSWTA
jgi:hypothetical protein